MADKRTAILILGMHRSGTSALTRVLNLCGVDLGEHLMPPAQGNNESGFWEHLDAVDLHERALMLLGRSWSDARRLPADWQTSAAAATAEQRIAELIRNEFAQSPLWAVKDPRLCRFVPLWINVLGEAGIDLKVIFVLRNPEEVIASLARRDGLSPHESGLLLLNHFSEAMLATTDQTRCVVTYPSLMDDWRSCVDRIAQELAIELPLRDSAAGEIERFLDRGARNHHADDAAAALGESLNGRIYRAALDCADSAQFWRRVGDLGDIWALYRNDLLPYVDELLDLLTMRGALESQGRLPAIVRAAGQDCAEPPLARLQFRMIAGLQDGVGRLGQASADLGAMVRIGSETAAAVASDIAAAVTQLRDGLPEVRQSLQSLFGIASAQQQQLGEALVQSDVLRRHIDDTAALGDQRMNLFAMRSDERLREMTQEALAACAESEQRLTARLDALAVAVEAVAEQARQQAADMAREKEAHARLMEEEARLKDEARWSRRLRRLISGK